MSIYFPKFPENNQRIRSGERGAKRLLASQRPPLSRRKPKGTILGEGCCVPTANLVCVPRRTAVFIEVILLYFS